MSTGLNRLRTAHHLALRAQHTSGFDAAELLRAWPALAASAYAAQQMFEPRSGGIDRAIERISTDAQALTRTLSSGPWPGTGAADQALVQVTSALDAARSNPDEILPASEVAEAQRAIASILWTTSRLVGTATRDHYYDLTVGNPRSSAQDSTTAVLAINTYRRFNALEQLAASSLGGARRVSWDPNDPAARLRRAVAAWDIQAHRALVGDPSTTVLHVLAHLEAATVKGFEVFVNKAAEAGIIDGVTADRLTPILADSSRSWALLRDTAADLAFSSNGVPVPFIDAATAMQRALTDCARGATHGDHGDILKAVSSHLQSAVTISATARETISSGEMRAPARAVSRLLLEQAGPHSPRVAPVDPVTLRRGLSIPINQAIRDLLDEPVERVFLNAHEAVRRSSGLDALHRIGPTEPSEPSADHDTGKGRSIVAHRARPAAQPTTPAR